MDDDSWTFDATGQVDPPAVHSGAKYALCGWLEPRNNQRELVMFGLETLEANETKECLESLSIKKHRLPKTLITGGDQNFKAECSEWLFTSKVEHDVRPRYTPWRNPSESAVKVVQRLTTPALLESNLPFSYWEYVAKHQVLKYNVFNGIPEYQDIPLPLLAATGSLVHACRGGGATPTAPGSEPASRDAAEKGAYVGCC